MFDDDVRTRNFELRARLLYQRTH